MGPDPKVARSGDPVLCHIAVHIVVPSCSRYRQNGAYVAEIILNGRWGSALRKGPGEVGDVTGPKFITRDIADGKLLADLAQHLGLGAADVAAGRFEIVVDDIANRAALPSCKVEAARSFKLLVAAL